MSVYRVQEKAAYRIDEIYIYTRKEWGEAQADKYIHGLFDLFQKIADRQIRWRPVPAEFGVNGYFCRYEKHFIYWKTLKDGTLGIVTVLHERMQRISHLQEDFEG